MGRDARASMALILLRGLWRKKKKRICFEWLIPRDNYLDFSRHGTANSDNRIRVTVDVFASERKTWIRMLEELSISYINLSLFRLYPRHFQLNLNRETIFPT